MHFRWIDVIYIFWWLALREFWCETTIIIELLQGESDL